MYIYVKHKFRYKHVMITQVANNQQSHTKVACASNIHISSCPSFSNYYQNYAEK